MFLFFVVLISCWVVAASLIPENTNMGMTVFVSDGGAEVCELADSIEFVIVDGNDRRCFGILSQDIRLLQTDGQSEVLTGL